MSGNASPPPISQGDEAAGVRWAGAQTDVLAGDLRGHVPLETLSTLPHLYALGPLEGLQGEVSVFDGVPSIAHVDGEDVVTRETWRVRACFLVWASVAVWHETSTDAFVAGLDDLQARALALASRAGVDPGRPFPLRVRGRAVEVTFHVLSKRDGLPHNPERHEHAKVRRTLTDVLVDLVGFHSRGHRGVFTPAESDVHVHVRTADGRASGHLERARLAPGAVIAVPAPGWGGRA